MSGQDYFRPRGDITTVLDLASRDAQDNTIFSLNTENSWFHRGDHPTVYPTTLSVQEFTQRGPADWGQKCSFELGSLPAGDLLQAVILQIKLGHWYPQDVINKLNSGIYSCNLQNPRQYWTYANSLGTAIIESAEFIVNDQTIEKLSGEFIRAYYNLTEDINTKFGPATDGFGTTPYAYLSSPSVLQTAFNPNRPYTTENGALFCVLPFFFLRTKLKEVFPLLSCNEGNVRIDIKLRKFSEVVRNYSGTRENCEETPLGKSVTFDVSGGDPITIQTSPTPPQFRDFRILTAASLVTGTIRQAYLHKPFEQMVKLVQTFQFDEPLKYIVSKPNANTDTVEIQLPLELNHPAQEIFWVFRRKDTLVNNEWSNFTPAISVQTNPQKVFPQWLEWATLRINGMEVISTDGEWFREHIAGKHAGGFISWASYVYGYSFAEYPDNHQPSGTANMSRTNSITLNLRVNTSIPFQLKQGEEFDPITIGGWEVFVYAIHLNWLRFENGICNKMFSD
jgi:hypothetical protein